MATEIEQGTIDREHLRLLAIFHYVMGALDVLFASLFIIHFSFALFMGTRPGFVMPPTHIPGLVQPPAPPMPSSTLFHILAVVFGLVVLLGWTVGALTIYSGRCLAKRRKRTFSVVMAAINCLNIPFGTILGVFTLVVLERDSVRRLYAGEVAPLP